MAKFKEGDRVRVKARAATEQETLNGRYAPYLAGAVGTVLKVYDPQQIAVKLDIDTLPEEVRQRHAEQQQSMYQRWYDSLSEEARNRLTDEEKRFQLNYVVLLAESDLESPTPTGSRRTSSTPKTQEAVPQPEPPTAKRSHTSSKKEEVHPTKKQGERRAEIKSSKSQPTPTKSRKQATSAPPTPPRPTPDQLDQLEEAYLKARQRKTR